VEGKAKKGRVACLRAAVGGYLNKRGTKGFFTGGSPIREKKEED